MGQVSKSSMKVTSTKQSVCCGADSIHTLLNNLTSLALVQPSCTEYRVCSPLTFKHSRRYWVIGMLTGTSGYTHTFSGCVRYTTGPNTCTTSPKYIHKMTKMQSVTLQPISLLGDYN